MASRSGNTELQRNGHANECNVCKKKCDNTCGRCGEFYCSKQCQTVDWREHKYYCFEMPELITKSPPSNGQSNNSSNFRRGEHRAERDQLNSSDNSPRAAGSRHCERAGNNYGQRNDETVKTTVKTAAFTFAEPPRNNDDVVLTHVRNANSFYIRTCSSDSDYMKNAKDFDDYGRRGLRLSCLPQKNDIVLVRQEGKFQRGVVLQAESEDRIEVALADTGRKLHKSIHEMREISAELKSRARYNFIVTLAHIPNRLDSDGFKKLLDFRSSQTVFKIQFDGNDWSSAKDFNLVGSDSGLPIERLVAADEQPSHLNGNDTGADRNANDELNNGSAVQTLRNRPINGNAADETVSSSTRTVEEPIRPQNTVEETNKSPQSISFADLPTQKLNGIAKLIIIDNSYLNEGSVSAVDIANISKLPDLHEKVNDYGEAIHEVYEPKNDELCLVKFDEEWYRAVKCATKFLLIDWGILESIQSSDIRRYPAELKDPCCTFVCNIEGARSKLQDDPAKIEQLKELLDVQSDHPDCECFKVDGELTKYNVKFPKLLNFFD